MKNINIIILGSGFAGVAAAKGLVRAFSNSGSITIVSEHNYQLFNTNLFEVATAEEEFATISQLKKSIGLPLGEALNLKKINFVPGKVSEIDAAKQTLTVGNKKLAYDYLVVALGSVSDFFGIPGADQYALTLKSLPDALRIKNQIEFTIQAHRTDINKPNLRIVVAGGGYTGVEFAAELSHELEIVAWKNQYPLEKIELCVIEATASLIPGFSERLSQDALWHLKNRGVRVELSSPITSVDEHFLTLANGEKEEYDVLVWTTGVKAVPVPFSETLNTDKKGRLITNHYLQTDQYQNIFAIGDCACVINQDGRPAPPSAQDAITQGRYVAYALPLLAKNQRPTPYRGKAHGFIVTLGGRNAVVVYAGFYIKGYFGYIIRQLANLRYYGSVVGWWRALKYILFEWNVYHRND